MTQRPIPKFEDGYFIPAVPVPSQKPVSDYTVWDMILTLIKTVQNPLETFNEVHYRIPVAQYPLFGMFFTVINQPDFIRHCFVENRKNYGFQRIRQNILKPIIGEGLITAEGETWAHARKTMSPMFTPRNIAHFGEIMRRSAEAELEGLFSVDAAQPVAAPISALTYNVLSATLFSGDIEADSSQVLEDISTILSHMGRPDPMDLLGAPKWVPRVTRLPGLKAVKRVRRMISALTERRRIERQAGQKLPDDFLSRLLLAETDGEPSFTDQQIEDHVIAFIGAGHETTARALVWMFYLLSQDTGAREKVEAEVDALDMGKADPKDWGQHLPYTLACFEETMRLFPPAPLISRAALSEDQYGTSYIPANSVLMVNLWQLHRHETLWERPNAFDPERFLGANRDAIDRFAYLPFGVGERVCIGARFALQEAMILAAILLRNFRFDYADTAAPWPKMRITVQPDNGMPMIVTKRK